MTIDFLIGAIRASQDLHPQVKTELEEILVTVEEQRVRKEDRRCSNMDLRLEIFKSGLSYREIARAMNVTPVWLSRVMAGKLTPEMRRRIEAAISELKAESVGGAPDVERNDS